MAATCTHSRPRPSCARWRRATVSPDAPDRSRCACAATSRCSRSTRRTWRQSSRRRSLSARRSSAAAPPAGACTGPVRITSACALRSATCSGDNRAMPTAAVVGAQGVIGRYIVEKLAALPDWNVIGLSRRKGTDAPRVKHISVDLLDPADAKAKLAGLNDVTHTFFAAFQAGSGPAADYAKNIAANRDLLVNSVTPIDKASSKLERVVLVTGTKYYGSHLGPFKTPAREDDPRHAGANYYFDQID